MKKFELGQIILTTGAIDAFGRNDCGMTKFLARHQSGDWGVTDDDNKAINDLAMEAGFGGEPVLSAYILKDDTEIWINTEWDRSATTILLPEES